MKKEFDFRRKNIAILVSVACLTMASTAAMADCSSPVTGSQSGTCSVSSAADFVVAQGASVTTSDGTPAVSVSPSTTASSVTNNGSLSSNSGDGIVVNGTVTGAVGNVYADSIGAPIPTITTGLDAIHVSGGSAGWVSNAGTIVAGNGISAYNDAPVGNGIALDNSATVNGGIYNSGNITASGTGILVNGSTTGSIGNNGTLQSQTVTSTYDNGEETYTYTGPQGDGITVSNGSQVNGSVSNSGTINTIGGTGVTIDGSTVTGAVSNSGSITTGANGIAVQNGSHIGSGVSNTGSISGEYGIEVSDSTITGSVTNGGSINGFQGIDISDSTVTGSVKNSGSIEGNFSGINVSGSTITGSITNTGSIDTGSGIMPAMMIGGGSDAIHVQGSTVTGSITNSNSLQAAASGISVTGNSQVGSITNSPNATITSNGAAILVDQSSVRTNVTNQGTLTTGYGPGIELANGASAASVSNSGTINSNDADGIGLYNASHLSGNLINTGSVSVGQNGSGIDVANGSSVGGNLINTSSIAINTMSIDGGEGNQAGINVQSASSVTGSISNTISGSIIAQGGTGVLVTNSTVGAGISNSGQITADNGIVLNNLDGGEGSGSKVLAGGITNSGTISAAFDGIDVNNGSTVAGGISNTGAIFAAQQDSYSSAGIVVRNGSTVSGGVSNTGIIDATLDGGEGSSAGIVVEYGSTVNGGITNTGTITATGPNASGAAIAVVDGATVNGGIQNGVGGRLDGSYAGLLVGGAAVNGDVSNQGIVNGGMAFESAAVTGNISNASTGTITGAAIGVDIEGASTVSGKFVNNGSVTGTATGLLVADSAIGGVTNTGTLTGGTNGIALIDANVSGDVTNSGTIKGTTGDALSAFGSTLAGTIKNSGAIVSTDARGIAIDGGEGGGSVGAIANQSNGTIQGATDGIALSNVSLARGLTNAGSIVGSTGDGVRLDAATISAGGISNTSTGTISGAATAVLVGFASSVTGDINNAGHLSGGYSGLQLDPASTVHGNVVNSGAIGGQQGVVMYDSIVTGNLTNSGTITATQGNAILAAGASIGGQIANSGTIKATGGSGILLDGGEGSAHVGSIANAAGGKIIATGGSAIRASNTTVTNGIDNAGTLSGTYGIYLNDVSNGGSLTNHAGGTITGTGGLGIAISNSKIGGGIANAGDISGSTQGAGVILAGSAVNGSLVNSGSIDGAMGVVLTSGSKVGGNLTNSGSISGVTLDASTVQGNVQNAGTIGAAGLVLQQGAKIGGSITNGGAIAGVSIDASTVTGSLQNTSKIDGLVSLTSKSTLGGNLTNSGSIGGVTLNASTVQDNVQNTGVIGAAGLVLQQGAKIGGSIANGGVIAGVSVDASTVAGTLQNSGRIGGPVSLTNGAKLGGLVNSGTIGDAANAVGISVVNATLGGTIDNSGTISGATAIDLSKANTPVTIDNSGSLAGAVQLGAGTLNLNGASSQVAGAVTGTASSTINVNGNFSTANTFDVGAINIASGASLVDQHDLTASRGVTNTGTLAVRAATPVTVHGDYTQAAGGTYAMQASSPSAYSRLTVNGAANLAANTNIDVDVSGTSTLVPNGVLKGVIAADSLSASTFNVTDNSVLFNFKGVVDGNNVDLNVINAQTVLQQTNANSNFAGGGAARTFDYLLANGASGAMNQVLGALGSMTTSRQVSDAVKQTLPVLTGATAAGVTSTMNDVSRVVQARQEESRGLSAGDGYAADRHLWFKPFGSWAHQDDDNGAAGFTATTAGVVVGGDGSVSARDRVGGAFAYAHLNQNSSDSAAPQSARTDSYQAIVYGSHSLEPRTDISWQAGAGYNSTNGSRTITFTGGNATAASSYGGWNAHVGAGIGHIFDLSSAVSLTPSLRLDYTTVKNSAYTETGAGALDLNVDSQRAQELVLGGDAKLLYSVSETFSLTANAGLGYDALAKNAVIVSSFTGGGPAFATEGVSPSHLVARGGAGVAYHGAKGLEVVGRYDVQARSKFTNQTVSLKIRKSF
ncbi:outer membrane autotransporter [Caballeronia hypogeia]|uniref:Outer membrane autotransporter n=1 Tax=Caballeronia hypogeia TaxID=1777140 RepID=A0A158A1S2_9BURK|nr:hypothetical protein [Caballeronia hypogeia]SAK51761.1 outer membrane autotransporter [Caballeronia hypogeia]